MVYLCLFATLFEQIVVGFLKEMLDGYFYSRLSIYRKLLAHPSFIPLRFAGSTPVMYIWIIEKIVGHTGIVLSTKQVKNLLGA